MAEKQYGYIDRNLSDVRRKIEAAAKEAGREDLPLLMAAIKSADAGEIAYLQTLGVTDVGENRVQQLLERYEVVKASGMRLHFIGSLQTNKVKYIVDKVALIHSLDSEKLAREIEKQAAKIGKVQEVLIEINCGSEENKGGVEPEDAAAFALSLREFPHLRLRGFMTMAPKCEKNEEYHAFFSKTCSLALDIWEKTLHNIDKPILSMGMSGSFEQATRDGATLLRVGRTLFQKDETNA